ncbi:MAG: hypothetical protein AAF761_01070 [Pseudomonadota bacterium]
MTIESPAPRRGILRRFRRSESGAVTVDFVVIMAGIVVLGTIIVGMTRGGTEKVAGDIDVALSAVPVR